MTHGDNRLGWLFELRLRTQIEVHIHVHDGGCGGDSCPRSLSTLQFVWKGMKSDVK
jgi:hypothetical protein